MYGPKCPLCGSDSIWSCDYRAENFGYDNCDEIIDCYSCTNEECRAHIEVRDLYIREETEERSVKYYLPDYDEEDNYNKDNDINEDVEYCIYCSKTLETLETKPYQDDGEWVLTIKKCNHCDTFYEIKDIYPLEDIYRYPDDFLTIYDLRTVTVK